MKIESKFLTAEARVTGIRVDDRKLVMETLVKEFMPMTVTMDLMDARRLGWLVTEPILSRLRRRLPSVLARRLAGPAGGSSSVSR